MNMTVTLTEEQEAFVRRTMAEKDYASPEEVVESGFMAMAAGDVALRRWERTPEFKAMIEERMKGPFIPIDEFWDGVNEMLA